MSYLCYLCLFAYSGVQQISCCVFLCYAHPMLPVSLDCPLFIVPSVFSNVYLPVSLDCPLFIVPSVFSNIYLPVYLDCPLLIVPFGIL
jgi:hypothetical protein